MEAAAAMAVGFVAGLGSFAWIAHERYFDTEWVNTIFASRWKSSLWSFGIFTLAYAITVVVWEAA